MKVTHTHAQRTARGACGVLLLATLSACSLAPQSPVTPSQADKPTVAGSQPASTTPVIVTIGDRDFPAHLNDTSAATDLYRQLPLTLNYTPDRRYYDFSGDLSAPLENSGMSAGDDPIAGDIVYWSPQERLVFFWGDADQVSGIHVIGSFDDREAVASFLDEQGENEIEATLTR